MKNICTIVCLILGSTAELYLSKSEDSKVCNQDGDKVVTYDDIFEDADVESEVGELLETTKSGTAWISGYPRYSLDTSYHGCYNVSCKKHGLSFLEGDSCDLSENRTLFRCVDYCFTLATRDISANHLQIGISNKKCLCLTSSKIVSVLKDCAVDNSVCDNDREGLYNDIKRTRLDMPESGIIPIFSYIGTSTVTNDDHKKPNFKQCSYALWNSSTDSKQHVRSSCEEGKGIICSKSPHAKLDTQCPDIIEQNTDYCVVKKDVTSLLEAEAYCQRYAGVLSTVAIPVSQSYMDPDTMYLLGSFREFVISDKLKTTDKGDCVYAYTEKASVKFGTVACTSKLRSLCKSPESYEATIAGVCIGVLILFVVLVGVIILWKKRHIMKQCTSATPEVLITRQNDTSGNKQNEPHKGVNSAEDGGSKIVSNEYASVIYASSNDDSEYHYISTIFPQEHNGEICQASHKNSVQGKTITGQTSAMVNSSYDRVNLKGVINIPPDLKHGENVYDHTGGLQQHYDKCTAQKLNNSVDSTLKLVRGENMYDHTGGDQQHYDKCTVQKLNNSVDSTLKLVRTDNVYDHTEGDQQHYDKCTVRELNNTVDSTLKLVRSDNVYDHTEGEHQLYDKCSDQKINNTADTTLYNN